MKTKTSLILTVAALALSGSALAEVKIALWRNRWEMASSKPPTLAPNRQPRS